LEDETRAPAGRSLFKKIKLRREEEAMKAGGRSGGGHDHVTTGIILLPVPIP